MSQDIIHDLCPCARVPAASVARAVVEAKSFQHRQPDKENGGDDKGRDKRAIRR